MLKKILFFCTFCIYINASSQTLTIGQVYDYDPGDVFQYLVTQNHRVGIECGNPSTPYYNTDSVISKSYSKLNDTVFYTIKHRVYAPWDCYPDRPSPIYNSWIMNVSYTNLNSAVSSVLVDVCDNHNTAYISGVYCEKKVFQSKYKRREGTDTNCTYTSNWNTMFIEGCGSYSSTNSGNVIGYWDSTTELTYYKKKGKDCGTYNITAIGEEKNDIAVSLFPNPTAGKFQLNVISLERIAEVEMIDIMGRSVFKSKPENEQVNIDLSNDFNGVYMVKITDKKGNSIVKKVVKQ